jgi:23S rRNA pseudouridine2605 synthase
VTKENLNRLNKIIALFGKLSRRGADELIAQGRVFVNGKKAIVGQQVSDADQIKIDGEILHCSSTNEHQQMTQIIKYHKPLNVICSQKDEKNRETIFDHLQDPISGKWINVGRLDYKTSGLILLTNNGELAHHLMHPSQQIEREYHVKIQGDFPKDLEEKLKKGVKLDDGWARAHDIRVLENSTDKNTWLSLTLCEGRNREVRRLFEAVNRFVLKLVRVRYGQITLTESLQPGTYEFLSDKEQRNLMSQLGYKWEIY